MKYEIQQKLVLSTAHIPQEDNDRLLMAANNPFACPLIVLKVENEQESFGFDIRIEDFHEIEVDAIRGYGLSEDFISLYILAHNLNCQWLRLDRDGNVHEHLPSFEWE